MGDEHTPSWLILAEVSGIQDWIVGHATELRVIRGGSLLLDKTFEAVQSDLTGLLGAPARPSQDWPAGCRWQLIARSSGRLSALVADGEDIGALTAGIRARLARDLPGIAVSVTSAPLSGARLAEETSFDAARRRARTSKTHEQATVPAAYHLGTETCDASGIETASEKPTAEGWFLSPMSERRQRADALGVERDDIIVERRIDRIGRATISTRYAGYIAVVCADGNEIGARFRGLHEAEDVERESNLVESGIDSVEAAAYDAAVVAHLDVGGELPLRLNPVVRAGDDLRYVMPAHVALAFAQALTSTSADLQACAGVLLCHATLPFAEAHDTAEELLIQAKQASRQHDRAEPYVAFAAETAAGTGPALGQNLLSGSPYRAYEINALLTAAKTLDVSSSQLRNVMEALRQRGRVADREWALHYLGSTGAHRRTLAELWRVLQCPSAVETEPFPVTRERRVGIESRDVEVSPLGDLLLLRQLAGDALGDERSA